jgi:hypothetical protein
MHDEKFQIGDWVYYNGEDYHTLHGGIGYITIAGEVKCEVQFIQDHKGLPLRYKKMLPNKDLLKSKSTAPILEEEFKALIDLALETKDFEWCRQLVKQFEGRQKEMEKQSTLHFETK